MTLRDTLEANAQGLASLLDKPSATATSDLQREVVEALRQPLNGDS